MTDGNDSPRTDEAVEALLRKAPLRPMPSDEDTTSVRNAVRVEWNDITGRRRVRRRLVTLAAAATVLLAVGTAVTLLRVPSAIPVTVATIDKTIGSIYLLGEQPDLYEAQYFAELTAGQTLVTGHDSVAGIAWLRGGSLRIDEDSRVEFLSPDEILLRSGRIYVDSQPSSSQAGITQGSLTDFVIRTEYAIVNHLGTQYMAGISGDALTISVREGRVEVEGTYHDAVANAGQQLTLAGSNRPTITNIRAYGDDWQWAEKAAPAVSFDGRSAYEFIAWVARESGFEVHFTDAAVERHAHDTKMNVGTVRHEPQAALRLLLQTADLDSKIENGRIVIRKR